MLTPSSIIVTPFRSPCSLRVSIIVERRQVLHDAPTENAPPLEIMIEDRAHQSFRLRCGLRVRIAFARQREQRFAAYHRPLHIRLSHTPSRTTIESVMVT